MCVYDVYMWILIYQDTNVETRGGGMGVHIGEVV